MVGRLLVGFLWPNLLFSVSWQVDFQWASCVSIFSFLCHGWQTFSGFVWLKLQFSVSWLVDFQWGSCGSIFSFLCHGWQTFSGVRVAQSLVFCVMVGRLLVGSCGSNFSFLCHGWQTFSGFVWLKLQFSVSWLVDFQWGSCGSIFSFLCHGWQTFSGFVRFKLQFSVSWLVDFQWGSCGSIFSFLCHGWQTFSGFVWLKLQFSVSWWQTFSGFRVAQSLVFCVMVGRPLVGFVLLNLQFSVSWQVDFQWGSYGSIFSFLCHGWQTFSGVRVAQSLVFCVMVGRLLVGFVWLNLQFSVSWLVEFQWGSCGSIFSFLCHGRQTFSGVRVAQSLVFCVMVGRLLVGFVWLNLQFSVSWLVDFQWGSCGSIFSFLCQGWRLLVGFVWINLYFSVSWLVDCQWVRVAQYLDFCVMIGGLLVGFVWLNLLFSVSWLVDFYWVRVAQTLVFCVMVGSLLVGSCGSNFSFLCHGWQTFSGVRVAQSLCFLCHGWQTFGGVRVAQSLVFCVMVGRLLVGFVWLNLQFSVSWLVDVQLGSCGSIFSFLCHGWQIFSGFRVAQSLVFCVMVGRFLVGFLCLNLQFSVLWLVDFQWGSCGSIFCFLCHGWQTFSGVRVAQSLVFCVIVGRLLVGFVWLNLQLSVSWLVDFQWGSWGSIFSFLCHGWQTFSGVRVAQSLVFCVMVGRLLVGFVWLNLQFSVSRLATFSGFVLLNLQFSVSWLVDFQWGSCGSIFSFLRHGWHTFSGVRVSQSLVFCVMVGRLLVGFVWLNLQFSVSWQVDFQWGSCGSILSFLCHGWQTFSGVRVAQSLVFCVMVGRLLVGFVWLNLQFSVSRLATFSGVRVDQSLLFCLMVGRLLVGSCGSIFRFLCHDWWTFSGVRVAQSFIFCVMVGRLLLGSCGSNFSFLCHGWQSFSGFVWLKLQFSVSWLVDFQWGSCGSIVMFSVSWLVDFWWGSCGSIFSFLCHGWQTFSGIRVAQSLVFCVMVGRCLVGFVWLNLQLSVSWLVDFQWVSCGSIFSFLCHGRQIFSGLLVSQSLVFCVMVGRLLVGFVWLNLLFSVSWLVDFQWGSCGSIFSFLCHRWQTFSGVRVAQSLVVCVMVGRLLVGFVGLNLQFSVSWLVDFQWGSRGSIFSFLCHGWQTFSGVRVAQSLVFCVKVGDFQWVRVAQSLVFCLMVGRLLVGFVWFNLQFSASWLAYFQWGSCVSIFSFLRHGWETFSGVRVAQTLFFCVMVGRLLVGFV